MRKLSRGFVGSVMIVTLLGLFVLGSPVAAGVSDAGHDYISTFSSGEENPPTDTGTYGLATFHINDDGQTMDYRIWLYEMNDPTAAHIHLGGLGTNGPVIVPLYSGKNAGVASGTL